MPLCWLCINLLTYCSIAYIYIYLQCSQTNSPYCRCTCSKTFLFIIDFFSFSYNHKMTMCYSANWNWAERRVNGLFLPFSQLYQPFRHIWVDQMAQIHSVCCTHEKRKIVILVLFKTFDVVFSKKVINIICIIWICF